MRWLDIRSTTKTPDEYQKAEVTKGTIWEKIEGLSSVRVAFVDIQKISVDNFLKKMLEE